MRRTVHTARCVRDGDGWRVTIDGVQNGFTQARRLDQVPARAREVVTLLTGASAAGVDIDVAVELPPDLEGAITRAAELRDEAAALRLSAAEALRAAVVQLAALQLPIRDIGALVGLSHQRVSQILATSQADAH